MERILNPPLPRSSTRIPRAVFFSPLLREHQQEAGVRLERGADARASLRALHVQAFRIGNEPASRAKSIAADDKNRPR